MSQLSVSREYRDIRKDATCCFARSSMMASRLFTHRLTPGTKSSPLG